MELVNSSDREKMNSEGIHWQWLWVEIMLDIRNLVMVHLKDPGLITLKDRCDRNDDHTEWSCLHLGGSHQCWDSSNCFHGLLVIETLFTALGTTI